jgi:hypothetical protein
MMIQKEKSWNGLKIKQRSANQLHVQAFGTIGKQNILVRLAEDELTLSF